VHAQDAYTPGGHDWRLVFSYPDSWCYIAGLPQRLKEDTMPRAPVPWPPPCPCFATASVL